MEEYKKKFDDLMDSFDSWLSTIAYMDKLESIIGIRKCYIGVIIGINIALAVFFSLGAKTVGNIVVFLYPAYMSLMSIKNEDKSSHIQWLSYWVVYGISCILDSMQFISRRIPYFSLLRIVFLILCFLPNVRLSERIYMSYSSKAVNDSKKND